MDQGPTTAERKAELIERLARSRSRLEADRDRVRRALHPVRGLRRAVSHHPWRVFGIAAGGAFLLALLRRRRSSRKRGVKGYLFTIAFTLAKPALRNWLLKQAKARFLAPDRRGSNAYQAHTP